MSKMVAAPKAVQAPVGRQEARTRETRELLLRAAESIFIRDGYEGTDLKDIAALAGRTKGAIYGHFKSKEDIFLALVADHRIRHRAKVERLITEDVDKNLRVLREMFRELSRDRDWALLQLEYKMFILRHPESKERFQQAYMELIPDREMVYAKLIGTPARSRPGISRALALHSMMPMLSALLLEAEFDPGLLTPRSIQALITEVFDCLLGPGS